MLVSELVMVLAKRELVIPVTTEKMRAGMVWTGEMVVSSEGRERMKTWSQYVF